MNIIVPIRLSCFIFLQLAKCTMYYKDIDTSPFRYCSVNCFLTVTTFSFVSFIHLKCYLYYLGLCIEETKTFFLEHLPSDIQSCTQETSILSICSANRQQNFTFHDFQNLVLRYFLVQIVFIQDLIII